MKTKLFSLQLIFAAFLCVTSCSKDDDGEPIPATLDKTSISLYVDETSTLTYSGENCNWSSDNTLVAGLANGPHWKPRNSGLPLSAHLKILG